MAAEAEDYQVYSDYVRVSRMAWLWVSFLILIYTDILEAIFIYLRFYFFNSVQLSGTEFCN